MSTRVQVLADIAIALTKALSVEDRYQRLLQAWRRAVPFDAAALLRARGWRAACPWRRMG